MQQIPPPTPEELQIHVLHETDRFVASAPIRDIEDILAATERRLGISVADRTDQLAQMRLRILAAETLGDRETSAAKFTAWTAALVMWLAFRHFQHGDVLRRTLDARAKMGRPSVLSVGIAYPPDVHRGTAWSFHIEDGLVDARAELARTKGVTLTEGFA